MKLVLADVNLPAIEDTVKLLPGASEVLTQLCNVANAEEVEALADAAYGRFGDVHVVFNNAGVFSAGPVWGVPLADWSWVMGVNVMGVVHGVRSFVPRMVASGQPGHIVNTASLGGFVSPPGFGVYAVSKHAVVALTECLFQDLQRAGATIGVTLLCPAFVATSLPDAKRNLAPEVRSSNPEGDAIAEQMRNAMLASTVSAADVAQMAIEAILNETFYVFTHRRSKEGVQQRFDDILIGRTPLNPFARVLTTETP